MRSQRASSALLLLLLLAPASSSADPPGNAFTPNPSVPFTIRSACVVQRANSPTLRNQLLLALSGRADMPCPNLALSGAALARGSTALDLRDTLVFVLQRNPSLATGTYTLRNLANANAQVEQQVAAMPAMPQLPRDRAPTPEELARFQAAAQRQMQAMQGVQQTVNTSGGWVSAVFLFNGRGRVPESARIELEVRLNTFSPERVEGTFRVLPDGPTGSNRIEGTFRAPLTVDPRGD